jgi:inosine/xanthosine triphosphatase
VSDQPVGRAETVAGARTRAERALTADDADYAFGVGVEGGVADVGVPGATGLFLVVWAAVTDGERTSVAAGPSLALPASVAERVRAGEELGPVMDDVLETEGLARRGGAAAALTGGALDRERALAAAVAGAAGPFRTDLYD